MSTVFPPLLKGFSWVPSTTGEGGVPLAPGEIETGSTIGVRADSDTTHSIGNYQWFVVVNGTVTTESTSDFQGKLNLAPGNYWAALNQTDMLNGAPSTSAWTPEVPFSIPSPIVKPAAPTGFTAA